MFSPYTCQIFADVRIVVVEPSVVVLLLLQLRWQSTSAFPLACPSDAVAVHILIKPLTATHCPLAHTHTKMKKVVQLIIIWSAADMCLAVIASRSKWKRASHWEWEEERERLLQHWPYLFERVWTWICLLSMWTVFVRLCMLTLSDCTEQTGCTHSVKWVPLCVLFLSFFRLSEWVSNEYCLWAMSIGTIGTRANTYIKEKESGTKGAAQTKIKLETDCLMKKEGGTNCQLNDKNTFTAIYHWL